MYRKKIGYSKDDALSSVPMGKVLNALSEASYNPLCECHTEPVRQVTTQWYAEVH